MKESTKSVIALATILAIVLGMISFCLYATIGTCERVDEIKERAPEEIASRGWEIMRYEGWQFGKFSTHGGKVWYHVRNKDNHDIQYRVFVVLWGGELHFVYGAPEKVNRVNVEYSDRS